MFRMEAATTEDKFNHAVELIKNLPKQGSFQPSNDLKLRLYSYFKQVIYGPCSTEKPFLWDIVNRAKWDAWSKLGTMAKEEAMEKYIAEFVKILKTTPFDEKAYDYVHLMGPYMDFAPKEFQENNILRNGNISDKEPENGHLKNGTSESDCEEFSDTFDESFSLQPLSDQELSGSECRTEKPVDLSSVKHPFVQVRGGGEPRNQRRSHSPVSGAFGRGGSGDQKETGSTIPPRQFPSGSGGDGQKNNNMQDTAHTSDVNEQLAFAVIRLQHTMEQLVNRLDSLEAKLLGQDRDVHFLKVSSRKISLSSLFGIPMQTVLLILVWPFISHLMLYIMKIKRHK